MGLVAWLDLEPIDVGALIAADLLGFLVAWLCLPNIYLAESVDIFLSYHLFLAWLVINAKHKTGLSLHIALAIVTHLACFALVYICFMLSLTIGQASASTRGVEGMAEGLLYMPIFRVIRYCLQFCIPALAVFERGWLFAGRLKKREEVNATAFDPTTAAVYAATIGDDYEAWNQHLANRNPLTRKPGATIKEEHDAFMAARVKARAAAAAAAAASENNPA